MTQHKAPTAITIAPVHEKSGLGLWVEKYWKIAAVVVVLITAWILYQARARQSVRVEGASNWSKVLEVASTDRATGGLTGTPADLRRVAGEIQGTPAAAWALYLAATSAMAGRKLEEAEAALTELRTSYPSHALVTAKLRDEDGGEAVSVVDRLLARIAEEREFVRTHPTLFGNPELPADAPRVRLTTDRGAIVVGLYSNLAPEAAENFLKLVRDGYYSGTKFHSVYEGQYVQGGDPNTKDQDPTTWGQGGPEHTLERKSTGLKLFAGVLAAAPAAEPTKISGSQFVITTAAAHILDTSHLPFGKVLEGQDVVDQIASAPIAEGTFNRPATPVAIQSAEVL